MAVLPPYLVNEKKINEKMVLHLSCINYKKAIIIARLENIVLFSSLTIDLILMFLFSRKLYYRFKLINIFLILIELLISECYHEFGHFIIAKSCECNVSGILFEKGKQNWIKTLVLNNDLYKKNKKKILFAGIRNNIILILIFYMFYSIVDSIFFRCRFLEMMNINIVLSVLNFIPIGESDGRKILDSYLKE